MSLLSVNKSGFIKCCGCTMIIGIGMFRISPIIIIANQIYVDSVLGENRVSYFTLFNIEYYFFSSSTPNVLS